VLGAAAPGFWFLVLHEAAARRLRGVGEHPGPLLAVAAAAAGVLIASFTFTNWHN
jgi:hypothetical protein